MKSMAAAHMAILLYRGVMSGKKVQKNRLFDELNCKVVILNVSKTDIHGGSLTYF